MKQKLDYRLYLSFVGGLIFQLLFWREFFGINLLLYSAFILAITFFDKELPLCRNKIFTAAGHMLVACYMVYNNSTLVFITWLLTLLIYIGQVHFPLVKSTFTSMLLGALQILSGPYGLFIKLKTTRLGKINFKPLSKPIKFVVVPLLLVVIFCSLYANANVIFDKYVSVLTTSVRSFFSTVFDFLFVDISLLKFLMILIGILITSALLVGLKSKVLNEIELGSTDELIRKKRDRQFSEFLQDFRALLSGNQINKKLGLKTETVIGVISFVALNALLLLLNGIDIANLWLGGASTVNKNLSTELHDGTNVLIVSILIAMLIIVYFFSGNINFYSRNKWIKLLAYFWIGQNIFLVASVLHRDYDYIFYHGLTYKRIGVAIFALLCLVGLSTVYIKVAQRKTVFYLYRVNSKIWYFLLIILSLINWDKLIVNYNFSKANRIGIDVDHLMSFSDHTLPFLQQHRDLMRKYVSIEVSKEQRYNDVVQPTEKRNSPPSSTDSLTVMVKLNDAQIKKLAVERATSDLDKLLNERSLVFLKKQEAATWLSFSYLDWKTKNELLKK
jgi:hypothetical protein